jgi:16S rRNA processing protein RimM
VNPSEYYKAGKIMRMHGVKGELSVSLHEPELFGAYAFEAVFINPGGGLVPFFVTSFSFNQQKNILLLQLEGIDDKEAASPFVQREVYLQSASLPKPDVKQFFAHEVIGFLVTDEEEGELGLIEEVLDFPMQQIFKILKGGKEILIPAIAEIIININRQDKTILLRAPEGLLAIYLSGDKDEEE